MCIAIIGYRGVGKTSVGGALAQRLGVAFFDVDALVVAEAGKSIAAIVAAGGWQAFRALEKRLLAQAAAVPNCVIATGGGAVEDEDNQGIIRGMDAVVWLVAQEETIVGRLRADSISPEQRPRLLGEDWETETRHLLCRRTPLYRQLASLAISTDDKGVMEIVAEIAEIMEKIAKKGAGNGGKLLRKTV